MMQSIRQFGIRIASSYISRRLALMLPTLIGIMLVNFVIIQAAPGGPVDQAIARLQGEGRRRNGDDRRRRRRSRQHGDGQPEQL